ncbi:cytochrome b5 [Sporormia fimetaria CBS 119925]|uniref:Cytochrome b5 n=1 Tax=Sporormia fimetaria CBS 119925 TaxID=1340428 RepID=A0A6A6VD22_9PLEO|nr:cytochrome b5 [Sporormia fimetaria CBS 119925]
MRSYVRPALTLFSKHSSAGNRGVSYHLPVYCIHATNDLRRASPITPINLILLSLFVFLAYLRMRPAKPQTLPRAPPPTVFRTFTPPDLFPYNGLNGMPVYLAVRGRVFDVTSGRNFYGPGGPYANFAGRDASRGLACGSFDENMLTSDLDGPLDTLSDLNQEQMEALQGWEERFLEKYLVVGKLVAVGSEEAKAAQQ